MKIKKSRLESIIKEEIESALSEVGLCHNDKGHFDDCDAGNVYSLTTKGAKDNNIDDEYVQRGSVVSKEKRKPPKIKAKYGANTSPTKQAGRKKISGQNISPKYSVSKYPEKYVKKEKLDHPLVPSSDDAESDRLDKLGFPHSLRALGKGIVRADEDIDGEIGGVEVDFNLTIDQIIDIVTAVLQTPEIQQLEMNQDALRKKCTALGMISMSDAQQRVLRGVNQAVIASKGEMFKDTKK